MPSSGAGSVNHGCGNSAVGIVNEGPIATGIVGAASGNLTPYGNYAPGIAGAAPGNLAPYGNYAPGLVGNGAQLLNTPALNVGGICNTV